jgi:hypothetical protein
VGIRSGTGYSLALRIFEDWTTNTGGTTLDAVTFDHSGNYADGVDDGEVDRQVTRRSTALTGSEVVILSNFTSPRASGLAMVRVNTLVFVNDGDVDLTIGPDATIGWTALLAAAKTVEPGGCLLFDSPGDGLAVTAGSVDRLEVDCPVGTGSYFLAVAGQSA